MGVPGGSQAGPQRGTINRTLCGEEGPGRGRGLGNSWQGLGFEPKEQSGWSQAVLFHDRSKKTGQDPSVPGDPDRQGANKSRSSFQSQYHHPSPLGLDNRMAKEVP